MISVTQRKPSHTTTKLTLLLSAKMNETQRTKEDTGKAMNNVLHVLRYAKRAEVTSNSKKIESIVVNTAS